MSNPQVAHRSRPDAMPELELDALSRIYRKAIERYEEANATDEDGGEGREEEMNFTRGPPQS